MSKKLGWALVLKKALLQGWMQLRAGFMGWQRNLVYVSLVGEADEKYKKQLRGDFADRCCKELDKRRAGGGKDDHGTSFAHQEDNSWDRGYARN
jgi:hypothetical protein